MPRFLIELPHEADEQACIKAVDVILRTGSHFFSRADWGCKDGEHKAWVIVEVDNKEEARGIVPVAFRNQAKVVQLNAFTQQEITQAINQHPS